MGYPQPGMRYPSSQTLDGVPPGPGTGYPPDLGLGTPLDLDWVPPPPTDLDWVPPHGTGLGTPPGPGPGTHPQTWTGYPPDLDRVPPLDQVWIRQSSTASICYAAGGVPLAFTQEDFLVFVSCFLCCCEWPICSILTNVNLNTSFF